MSGVELQSILKKSQKRERDNPGYQADTSADGIPPEKTHRVNNDLEEGLRHRSANHNNTNTSAAMDKDNSAAAAALAAGDGGDKDLSGCAKSINDVQTAIVDFVNRHWKLIVNATLVCLLLAYMAYFTYALSYRFGDEGSVRLLVVTVLGLVLLAIHLLWDTLADRFSRATARMSTSTTHALRRNIRWALYVISVVTMVTLLIVLVAMETPGNLVSLAGLAGFILLSWVTSKDPAKVNWHPVFWGFSLQFFFACIILRTRGGYQAFKWIGDQVTLFLSYASEGAVFVFGENYQVHFFAFAVMPMIVFFSSVTAVLYYLGVMQKVVSVVGRFLGFCLSTTATESLCAALNIFMGMTDAPLMVRPFLPRMSKSELHAIMTGGFATIAGSVLGAYIGFGVPANHLLSASVMSAPAALAISKLTYPETEPQSVEAQDYNILSSGTESNLIEAASAGASNSLLIVGSVIVNILAFLSLLKFVNSTLTWFGDRVGVENFTFELICSYVLYPVAVFMGTELGPDCRRVGELVGIKTFTNEFIAYRALRDLMNNRKVWANYSLVYNVSDPANVVYDDLDVNLTRWGIVLHKGFLQPRSEVIATYALCGFSNFGSMGILLGGMTAMAPERRADLSSIVFRAMIAGNVACFFTACIAGLFFREYDD